MEATIPISPSLLKDLIMLHRVERGLEGNYTRVEPIVDALRYKVTDRINTLVMQSINSQLGRRAILHTYSKK